MSKQTTQKTSGKTCSRCEGTGKLPRHANVWGGICFKCWGTGRTGMKKRQKPKPTQPTHDPETGRPIVYCVSEEEAASWGLW